MGTTLTNGVYLPNEGERNCYAGLKTNWEILDQKVADVTALQQAVAGALHREIVESLPTTDINPNTIYMILSGTSATENVYNEYMYVNNAWELIGTSATDLTNYYTKSEVDGKLLLKANASDLTSHTGDTTIHVTTADKNKWNNQTYVFRYSSTTLVASSTNSNALLDNTDNLKVGDKVIDSSGVLFSITAIDTANSTFTIGTALADLALDSDVVHKSGDESITGNKNFEGILSTQPISTLWTETANTTNDITMLGTSAIHVEQKSSGKLSDLSGGAWTVAELGVGCFFFRINNGADIRYKNFAQNTVNRILVVSGANRFINNLTPDQDNTYNLGDSTRRWSTINGLNPSSLGMPDLNNGIDISSYISYGADRYDSTYTAPADGVIAIYGTAGSTASGMIITNGHYAQSSYSVRRADLVFYCGVTLPVSAGDVVTISTNNVTSLINAYFYPFKGNV